MQLTNIAGNVGNVSIIDRLYGMLHACSVLLILLLSFSKCFILYKIHFDIPSLFSIHIFSSVMFSIFQLNSLAWPFARNMFL